MSSHPKSVFHGCLKLGGKVLGYKFLIVSLHGLFVAGSGLYG